MMKITCPDCGFFRELTADRAPTRPVVATCPKCGCRFRFQPEDGACNLIEHGHPAPAVSPVHEDDPLPPGAIVPGRTVSESPAAPVGEEQPSRTEAKEHEPDADKTTPPDDGNHANEEASRPTNRKSRARPAPDEESTPWDLAPRPAGYFSAFYQTTLRVMFGAERFFAHLNPRAPQFRALGYAIIIALFVPLSLYLWLNMSIDMLEQSISEANAPYLSLLRAMQANPLLFTFSGLMSLIFYAYIASVLLFLGFRITGVRHASFHIIFQIVAYSGAPLLLSIIPLGLYVGAIWSLASIVNGCRIALRLDWPRTLLGIAPIVLLLVLLTSSIPFPR